MAGILPDARQNNPKLPLCLITPYPPGYFSLAVERFEMTHAPILTARNPDFSGQKWTDGKSSGGKTGGPTIRMRILNSRVKLWRAKPSNENKMSHAAKNATGCTKQVELQPNP